MDLKYRTDTSAASLHLPPLPDKKQKRPQLWKGIISLKKDKCWIETEPIRVTNSQSAAFSHLLQTTALAIMPSWRQNAAAAVVLLRLCGEMLGGSDLRCAAKLKQAWCWSWLRWAREREGECGRAIHKGWWLMSFSGTCLSARLGQTEKTSWNWWGKLGDVCYSRCIQFESTLGWANPIQRFDWIHQKLQPTACCGEGIRNWVQPKNILLNESLHKAYVRATRYTNLNCMLTCFEIIVSQTYRILPLYPVFKSIQSYCLQMKEKNNIRENDILIMSFDCLMYG